MQPVTEQPQSAKLLEVVLPEHASHYGALYGAHALQMMGKAAFVCGSRHSRCPVMMAKADGIEFVRPVAVGSVIDIRARVVFQGRSSMTVTVEIVPDAHCAQPAISGRFMMVAVDDAGVPKPIPPLEPRHAEEAVS